MATAWKTGGVGALGAIFGAAFSASILAQAAPGDVTYNHQPPPVCINGAKAGAYADLAIADGAWDLPKSKMTAVIVTRESSCSAGFELRAQGVNTAPGSALPVSWGPVQVLDVAE